MAKDYDIQMSKLNRDHFTRVTEPLSFMFAALRAVRPNKLPDNVIEITFGLKNYSQYIPPEEALPIAFVEKYLMDVMEDPSVAELKAVTEGISLGIGMVNAGFFEWEPENAEDEAQ